MRRCRLQRTVAAWIPLPYLRFVFSPCGQFRTFLFLFLFPLSPSFGLEVQVKGIAGFEGFHGGSLPEMKSAVVLISPSPATPAVRFIRSKECAREKDESCYELAAPPLRRTTLHRASASPRQATLRLRSLASILSCRASPRFGPLHRREATPLWIEGDRPDQRGSVTRGSQSPDSADFFVERALLFGRDLSSCLSTLVAVFFLQFHCISSILACP